MTALVSMLHLGMVSAATLFDYPAQDALTRAGDILMQASGQRPMPDVEEVPGLTVAVAGVAIALQDGLPFEGRERLAEEWLIPNGRAGIHLARAVAREIEAHDAGTAHGAPRDTMMRIAADLSHAMGAPGGLPDRTMASITTAGTILDDRRQTVATRNSYMHERLADLHEDGVPLFRDGAADASGRHIRAEMRLDALSRGAPAENTVETGIAAHIRATRHQGGGDMSAREARLAILAEHDHSRPLPHVHATRDPAADSPEEIAIRTEALALAMREARQSTGGREGMRTFRRNQSISEGRLASLDPQDQIRMFTRLHHGDGVNPLLAMTIGMKARRMEIERQAAMRDVTNEIRQDQRAGFKIDAAMRAGNGRA